MKRIIYITLAFFLSLHASAQIGIGINTDTPDASSALDIESTSGGLLLSRMTTAQKTAITKPAHSLLVYDTDKKCVSQNEGTETVPVWSCLTMFNKQFFFMPSINIDTDVLNTVLTKDLYAQYQAEFGTPLIKNAGASSTSIPHYSANELYYYVTYFDPSVIKINGISDIGVLNYTVLKEADFDAYMNIVFVIK